MLATAAAASGRPASGPPWWMVGVAATFLAYFSLLLHSDLTRPEPTGFTFDIHDRAMILHAVAPRTPAAEVGLAVGDRVLASNGHVISGRLDWLLIETNLRAGHSVRLDVERNGGRFGATLLLSRAPPSFWMTRAGATLAIARGVQLITLVLGLVVAFKRPFDRAARLGAWVLATLAVYSIVLPYQIAATWRSLPIVLGLALWVPFASSLIVAPLTFTLFATFPRPIVRSPWTWVVIWLPMTAALAPQLQFMMRAVYQPDKTTSVFDWTPLDIVATLAYTIAALAVLLLGYQRLQDVTERRRVRVLVFGSVVGLASVLPIVVSYWGRPATSVGYSVFSSPVVALGATVGLAFPASFAYAILRHRLFDVALIIRRGLQYGLARWVLVSIVPATSVVFLIDLWINRDASLSDVLQARGWGYLLLAGLAGVARLRRERWLNALDRRFFRERHSAGQVLRGISEDLRGAASVEAAAPRVVIEIEKAFHPELVALLRRSQWESFFHVVATMPPTGLVAPLPSSGKIVGLLDLLHRPVLVPDSNQAGLLRQLPAEEIDWLRQAGIELLVPIQGRPDMIDALFALGPKRSEEPYGVEDEDLLMAVADGLAYLIAREDQVADGRDGFEECPACGTCYDTGTSRCVHDDAALSRIALPRRLGGRYLIERQIGCGGMGTVYAALDTALQRPVAVKLLREDFVGGHGSEERFRSEARLAAGLVHPNVVTVHDFGMTGSGRAFFVMELLRGATLRQQLLRSGRVAAPRLVAILRDLAAAVDLAHERGMIHRDLKPENIFLCDQYSGEVAKILDFGLAKPLEPRLGGRLTAVGLVAGTPQYMAPEHHRGADPSPDWDLWALSVIAYEMMTGRLPFEPDPRGSPRFDTALVADLPAAVGPVFARALAEDPLDRPTSAREFVTELERALASERSR